MIPPYPKRRWQCAIGPITDDTALTLIDPEGFITEAVANGWNVAITHLHLINEHASVRTRVQILSRGQSDSIVGLTACGIGDAGSDVRGDRDDYIAITPGEAPGLKCVTTGASVVGFATGYTWEA